MGTSSKVDVLPQQAHITNQDQSISFLKTTLNTMYYLAMVPFKIENVGKSGTFVLTSHNFQKVACIITHISLLLSTIVYYWGNYSRLFHLSTNIAQLLTTTANISGTLMTMFVTEIIWFRQQHVLSFLNISRIQSNKTSKQLLNVNFFVSVLPLFWYLFHNINLEYFDATMYEPQNKLIKWVLSFTNQESTTFAPFWFVIGEILKLLLSHGKTARVRSRCLAMGLSLQLKGLGIEFENFLLSEKATQQISVKDVIQEYNKLKEIVENLNSWTEGFLITLYVTTISYLATLPVVIRDQPEGRDIGWYSVFSTAVMAFSLLQACDMPQRIQTSCKKWISQKQMHVSDLSNDEKYLLMAFSQEVLIGQPVAAHCKYFALTHNFIGSMIGFLITYGVIVFQMPK